MPQTIYTEEEVKELKTTIDDLSQTAFHFLDNMKRSKSETGKKEGRVSTWDNKNKKEEYFDKR